MSKAFTQLMAEHRRICILRVLAAPDSGGTANDSILTTVVNDRGVVSTRDQIKTALHWLAEQGLITLNCFDNGLCVVTITQRGLDVAAGRATVPGVHRPAPEA